MHLLKPSEPGSANFALDQFGDKGTNIPHTGNHPRLQHIWFWNHGIVFSKEVRKLDLKTDNQMHCSLPQQVYCSLQPE